MPHFGPNPGDRSQLFQTLKPACVTLSQAVLALNGSKADVQAVTVALEDLANKLLTATAIPDSLDGKLADYIFFPLSQVLRSSQRVTVRSLELSFQSLAILIDQGWRSQMQPQLAAQVAILCTLMTEKEPKVPTALATTNGLRRNAFLCLYHLFVVSSGSPEIRSTLTSEANFPQLGQTITALLDGIFEGASTEVQIAAVTALQALVEHVATREIRAAFLPGIVSKLTKVLTPQTKQRRNHLVLIRCLDVLGVLFLSTLSAPALADESGSVSIEEVGNDAKSLIDAKWLATAATQLQSAISNIVRLKAHSRVDVQESLARFCFVVLDGCRSTLANCSSIALNTLLILASLDSDGVVTSQLERSSNINPATCDVLVASIEDRLRSLPTVMLGADEHAKTQSMAQIRTAYGIVSFAGVDTVAIDKALASALRDSVVTTIQAPLGRKQKSNNIIAPVQSLDLAVFGDQQTSIAFSQPLVRHRGQESILAEVAGLTKMVASPAFASDLVRSLRQLQGDPQIASMWLLLDAIQVGLQRKGTLDDFLNLEESATSIYRVHLEELYSFSLDLLNGDGGPDDEPRDPRLQALALRTLALRAQIEGREFREELIDALYPVLHTLATPNERPQRDSITTLNVFAAACEYSSVRELIVENVDYLTNAVSLRLHAGDVSPAAPQVLLMMVRLAGPSLLPFLEDTIDSIFTALEHFHGYGLLVEVLFNVLSVVAQEGVQTPQLAIANKAQNDLVQGRNNRWRPTGIPELADLLREMVNEAADAESEEREAHPRRPWKGVKDAGSADDEAEGDDRDDEPQGRPPEKVEVPPPAPKTYALLHKITELTQHFLPSASPSLRSSLLSLIKTTTPATAKHENTFLPLINTLWPEIVSRLDDEEPHVLAAALEVVGSLCEEAGGFMRSRIVSLWPRFVEIHHRTARELVDINRASNSGGTHASSTAPLSSNAVLTQAVIRMRSAPADYLDTSLRLVWDSLTRTLTTVVWRVGLPPEHFDECLAMLESVLDNQEVIEALEEENADAVWLARMRAGVVGKPEMTEQGKLWRFADLSG